MHKTIRTLTLYLLVTLFAISAKEASATREYEEEAESSNLVVETYTHSGVHLSTPYRDFFISNSGRDQVIYEILISPAMQRLKLIHQYGPSHYVKAHVIYGGGIVDDYTRFDHSICVFVLLRLLGRPITEQIAGLLHDISHTAFSHVGDFVFPTEAQAYQDDILSTFLDEHGIYDILRKQQISIVDVLVKPYLDRVDYTIIGALVAGILTMNEVHSIVNSLCYNKRKKIWFFSNIESAKCLALASLKLTRINSGAPWNTIVYSYIAKALKRAVSLELITKEDFVYNLTDDEVWEILFNSSDPIIQVCMDNVLNHKEHLEVATDPTSIKIISPKFRGLSPVVRVSGEYHRLIDINFAFRKLYFTAKYDMERGFPVSLVAFSGRPPTPFSRTRIVYGC